MLFNLFIIKKMKKVVLFFGIAAAFALASCGGNSGKSETPAPEQTQETPAQDALQQPVDTTIVADTTIIADTTIVQEAPVQP